MFGTFSRLFQSIFVDGISLLRTSTNALKLEETDQSDRIPVAHTPILPGSLAMNRKMEDLPVGWTMHIHPEGKPYYHREAMEPEDNLLQGVSTCDCLASRTNHF